MDKYGYRTLIFDNGPIMIYMVIKVFVWEIYWYQIYSDHTDYQGARFFSTTWEKSESLPIDCLIS